MYQNARDFYILILYPATLLNFLCTVLGFPGGSDRLKKKKSLQCRWPEFDACVGKSPWRREWLPTPVFLLGEFHGQKERAGIVYCHLQSRVLFLFQSGFLLRFFSACLTRTSNNSGKSEHPFLFLISEEILSVFTIEQPLLCWVRFLPCLISGEFLSYIVVEFWWKLFLHLLRLPYNFYLSVSYFLSHIDWFVCIHAQDISHLIMLWSFLMKF